MQCVWCDKTNNITKDHLIPKVMGGKDLVPACLFCNRERGIFAQLYIQLKRINENKLNYKKRTLARRYLRNKNWHTISILEQKWINLEKSKFDFSPTEQMQIFNLLEKAKEKLWTE